MNGQGHFLAKKYGFIQTRVDEFLKPHGDGSVLVTHGLVEKPVGLPPLSLVDRYLIALQIEYLGRPLDKVLELKARSRPISLKRTAQNAKLDKGLASQILSPENHNTRQPERILRRAMGGIAGSLEAMMDTPRKKWKDNWRAQDCVIASMTHSSMQSQQFSQASITIPETLIGHLQSLNYSPPGRSTPPLQNWQEYSSVPLKNGKRNKVHFKRNCLLRCGNRQLQYKKWFGLLRNCMIVEVRVGLRSCKYSP